MINGDINLFNRVVYNEGEHKFLRIICQPTQFYYSAVQLGVKGPNQYEKREDILEKFELVPDETSEEEWDLLMKKAGYADHQIAYIKDSDDPEFAQSFMPTKRLHGDINWDI